MIIQAVLLMQLFGQTQVTANQHPLERSTLLHSGTDAQNRGDLDQAITDFRKATAAEPSSMVAFLKLGDAYMAKGDYGAAVDPLKRALELDPDSLPAQHLLGYALLSQGYATEAIPHLIKAHDSAALGIAYLETDQPGEAVLNLKDALAKTPDDPDLTYYLGRAGAALSTESRNRLLSDFAQTVRGHQALGQSYYAAKLYPQAEKEYEQAILLRPNLPGLRLELGEIYAAGSQWAQAEEQFRAETKIQPGNAEAAYRLGDALLQQGKMKEAADELGRSDSLRPDMPETLYALGRALAVNGPDAAGRALARVVELEKESPLAGQAYLLLAGIHRRQGKAEDAAREMQQYKHIQSLEPKAGK
jgi:tetratricopeptide (TPR) repeat protein